MSPDWESNWWTFGLQAGTPSTGSHQPGQHFLLFRKPGTSWVHWAVFMSLWFAAGWVGKSADLAEWSPGVSDSWLSVDLEWSWLGSLGCPPHGLSCCSGLAQACSHTVVRFSGASAEERKISGVPDLEMAHYYHCIVAGKVSHRPSRYKGCRRVSTYWWEDL